MKKTTTTKIVLYSVLIFCGIFMSLVMYGWLVLAREGAAELAGVIAGIVTIIVTGYVWKAKAENMIKLGYTKEEIRNED